MFKRKWYWYSVTLQYISKDGQLLSHKTSVIGKKEKNQILDFRDTKKIMADEFIAGIPKRNLCNGSINLNINAYIGRMPERKK